MLSIESVASVMVVAGASSVAIRLAISRLQGRYRAFFAFLILLAAQNLMLTCAGSASKIYYYVYLFTEPVGWLVNVLVVLELYSLVLKDYRGLYTVGRWCLIVAVFVGLTGSALSLLIPAHVTRQGHLAAYYYVAERAVYFSLVIFVATILVLLTSYPIVLSRNALVHGIVFSAYFFSNMAAFLILTTNGFSAVNVATFIIQTVNVGALLTWLVLLNSSGEQARRTSRPAWMPGHAEELAGQLARLNTVLLRSSRRSWLHLVCDRRRHQPLRRSFALEVFGQRLPAAITRATSKAYVVSRQAKSLIRVTLFSKVCPKGRALACP